MNKSTIKKYGIILTKTIPENSITHQPFTVHVPDFNIDTQGQNLDDAIDMAKDAINLVITDLKAENKPIPEPNYNLLYYGLNLDTLIMLVEIKI